MYNMFTVKIVQPHGYVHNLIHDRSSKVDRRESLPRKYGLRQKAPCLENVLGLHCPSTAKRGTTDYRACIDQRTGVNLDEKADAK